MSKCLIYSTLLPAPSIEGPPPKINPVGFLDSNSSILKVLETNSDSILRYCKLR